MLYPTTSDDLRRRRLIVAGITTALLLIAFVTYAALVHRGHAPSQPEPRNSGPVRRVDDRRDGADCPYAPESARDVRPQDASLARSPKRSSRGTPRHSSAETTTSSNSSGVG